MSSIAFPLIVTIGLIAIVMILSGLLEE